MSTLPPASSPSLIPSMMPVPLATRCPSFTEAASWTSLLADTSWGLRGLGRRRVRVRHPRAGGNAESLRLVVQSYREKDVVAGRPSAYARPLAATQRAVDSEQLRGGIQLDLVHFEAEDDEDVVVIAWAEEGEPDLDFDGLEARPPRAAHCFAAVEPLPS